MPKNRVPLFQSGTPHVCLYDNSPDKLAHLLGSPKGPALIDVRPEADFAADPRLIPGAVRRDAAAIALWAPSLAGMATIVIGSAEPSSAMASRRGCAMRDRAPRRWKAAMRPGLRRNCRWFPNGNCRPAMRKAAPVWVTRSRPKVDRIACPWLIRRFIDRMRSFSSWPRPEVAGVAEQLNAAPFDVDDVIWAHRGTNCTFDAMVEYLGLQTEPLLRLAAIVRGADTGRPDLVPESAGLLAASLGLPRLYADDLEQLEAGLALYDAFYRWCRDAMDEAHANHTVRTGKKK